MKVTAAVIFNEQIPEGVRVLAEIAPPLKESSSTRVTPNNFHLWKISI